MAHYRRINILRRAVLLLLVFLITPLLLSSCSAPQDSSRKVQKYFAGTEQEVDVYTISGRCPGPTLLIFSGIHGDEHACSMVAARYTDIKLKSGTFIIVPRLNAPALQKKERRGLGGDMNRLFDLPEDANNPDMKVVNLARSLINKSDYTINLHQGFGFYSPTWVNRRRNPKRWGQSNVIDAPVFDIPNGERLELEDFARRVAERSNAKINNKLFHFQVNNTNTSSEDSIHKEQRKSLTYYALTKGHKFALGLEVTKNCTMAEASYFLTIAINAIIEESGIETENLPSEGPFPSRQRPPKKKKVGKNQV